MESINKKVILFSLVLAMVATGMVFFYIKQQTQVNKEAVKSVKVLVAAKTLPAKHEISEGDFREDSIPRERLNLKAVQDKKSILGKRLKESVIEGEQILIDRLVDDKGLTMAYTIPKGKRAVSINVNEQIQVAGQLKQGDFVDVIASFDKEEQELGGGVKNVYTKTTKTILQNVQVIALGQSMNSEDKPPIDLPKTVTLCVKQEEVEKLVFASDFGIIRLALRNTDDNAPYDAAGSVRGDIVPPKSVVQIKN